MEYKKTVILGSDQIPTRQASALMPSWLDASVKKANQEFEREFGLIPTRKELTVISSPAEDMGQSARTFTLKLR